MDYLRINKNNTIRNYRSLCNISCKQRTQKKQSANSSKNGICRLTTNTEKKKKMRDKTLWLIFESTKIILLGIIAICLLRMYETKYDTPIEAELVEMCGNQPCQK